jgi:hypothetical protein
VNPNNRSADRSNCSSDHRQQINLSGLITTPEVNNKLVGKVANGWQLSPIFHWSTGLLTTATYGSDVALTAAGNQRAQQVLPSVYGDRSPTNYLNINAFLSPTTAPQGDYATTRPFTISGPNVWNIDLSLSRSIRVLEHQTLVLRVEAFNLTNSVMFGAPTAALNSSTFGHLTPQIQSSAPGNATTARVMQFALKYIF